MKRKKGLLLAGWTLLLTMVFILGSQAISLAASPKAGDDIASLVAAAKKEGKVTWVSVTSSQTTASSLAEGFKQAYNLPSSFQVEWINLDTARTITRINTEIRANQVTIDLPLQGVPAFFQELQKRGELLAYRPPEWSHFTAMDRAGLPWSEPYYYVPIAYTFILAWNPKFVKSDLTKWTDVLKPEFQGMHTIIDTRKGETYTYTYMGLRKVIGRDFYRQLGKLKPLLLLPNMELMQKAISGERPICIGAGPYNLYRQMREFPDTPLKLVYPQEGVVLLPINTGIPAKAPHPNAAKLFLNYLMSRDGQLRIVQGDGLFAIRSGLQIPANVERFVPPIEKLKVIPVDYKSITSEMISAAQNDFREDLGVD